MSIRLYKPDEINNSDHLQYKSNGSYTHTHSGICELSPISCSVAEMAGAEYTLKMVHPYDKDGKWRMLAEDYIISAPVPVHHVPAVNVYGTGAYTLDDGTESGKAFSNTNLYSNVMTQAKTDDWNYKLWASITAGMPEKFKWSKKKEYKYGDRVLKGTPAINIYKAIEDTEKGQDPTGTYDDPEDNPWEEDGELGDANHPNPFDDDSRTDAVVIDVISAGEIFYKLADFDMAYMYIYRLNVEDESKRFGFVLKGHCMELEDAGILPFTIEGTTITEQDFRIYKVDYDDDAKTVTVEAKHISYDLSQNAIMRCEINDEAPITAVVQLIGKTVNNQQKYFVVCDLKDADTDEDFGVDVDADWSWINPAQALLDPEYGFAGITKGKVIRDNTTFYVLKDTNNDHGFVIQHGKNLLGVQMTRDCDEVITRVLPYADDGSDGYLFLPEMYRDSTRAFNDYPFPRIEILESEYYVGQEIEKSDGSTYEMKENGVIKKMRKEAKKRFSQDKVDREKVTLDIDFLMLGDTEEYKQFKDAQTLNLYDTVKIITGPSAMVLEAQMSEYEYDSINRRYTRIGFGEIYRARRGSVASFMIEKGGVNYYSLAPGLKRKITRG